MSYRNDHDAALSRIDALEQELGEAREKAARDDSRIAMLERELADLRRHAEPAPKNPPPSHALVPPKQAVAVAEPAPYPHGPRISHVLLAMLVMLAMGIATFATVVLRSDGPAPVHEEMCTVRAVQSVRVIGFDGSGEVDLGQAPVEMTFPEWKRFSHLELRADGYDNLKIASPASPNDCNSHAWDLFRL